MKDLQTTGDADDAFDARMAGLPDEATASPLARARLMRQLPLTEQHAPSSAVHWQRVALRMIAAAAVFAAGIAVGRNITPVQRIPAPPTPAVSVQRAGTQYVASIVQWSAPSGAVASKRADLTEVAVATIAAAAGEVALKSPGDTLLARLAEFASEAREQLGRRSER